MDTLADRIKFVRNSARLSQAKFAERLGVTRGAVGNWELGGGVDADHLLRISMEFPSVTVDWLMKNLGDPPAPQIHAPPPPDNARLGDRMALDSTIPVYGQAVGGRDGMFVLNGNKISDILAPPSLRGIRDAYAVYVVGESMVPRYYPGEAVFVNPRLPVRQGGFVVAQIAAAEGEPPHAYVKRFLSRDGKILRLEQLNPEKELRFPVNRVVSVHRIIMGGDG